MKLSHDQLRLRGVLMIASLAIALTACGMVQNETTAQQAKPLTDGEIAAVMHALNQGEIQQAELALQKSDNPEVISTAKMIIADHQNMDRQTMSLAGVPDIQPQENALSRSLRSQSKKTEEKLNKLSGSEFDHAYLEEQAKLHQQAIDTVQNELLPAAKSPQLRQQLTTAISTLQSHRQHAQASAAEISRG